MPLDETLKVAQEIQDLRGQLRATVDELATVNARRTVLQNTRDSLQTKIDAKRAELRAAAVDV